MRDRTGPDERKLAAALAPRARVDDLVITESAGEVLVYDQAVHHIHHLNYLSAVIWRLCDGRRSMTDLVRRARLEAGDDVDDAVALLALTKLGEANLLDEPLADAMRVPTATRRSLVKRAAVATAIPAIVSISAPSAAAASSQCRDFGQSCTQTSQCCGTYRCGTFTLVCGNSF